MGTKDEGAMVIDTIAKVGEGDVIGSDVPSRGTATRQERCDAPSITLLMDMRDEDRKSPLFAQGRDYG